MTRVLATLLAGLAACASQAPQPFVLMGPALSVTDSLRPSESFADPAEGPVEDSSSTPLRVSCAVYYLKEPEAKGLRSAAGDATLVADFSGPSPVLETPRLTASTLLATGDAARTWLKELRGLPDNRAMLVAERSALVPSGAAYRVSGLAHDRVEDPRDWLDEFENRGPIPRELAVEVIAGQGAPRLRVRATGLDPAHEDQLVEDFLADPNLAASPPPKVQDEPIRREVLELAEPPASVGPTIIHLDSPFAGGNGTSFVFVLEVSPDPSTHEGETAAALARMQLAGEELAEEQTPLTQKEREDISSREAGNVFQKGASRSALLQVSLEAGAPLAADLALVADAADIAELRDEVFGGGMPEGELGWALDQAAWKLLSGRALAETLDQELQGLVLRWAGALASFPDIVRDAARGAASHEAFDAVIHREQRYFLEDSSPSARLRAYDWMTERGITIEGYDPLAERSARRAALEAEAKRLEADAAQEGQKP